MQVCIPILLFAVVGSAVMSPSLDAADTPVTITVDSGAPLQAIEGFGATTISWADGGIDTLGSMRAPVLDAVYNQVRLTMGDIHCHPYEGRLIDPAQPVSWDNLNKSNDNADPNTFDWSGFNWWRAAPAKTLLVDPAWPMGFTNFMLAGHVSTRWGDQWLGALRTTDRAAYLAEAAENTVAILVHWRNAYGYVPEWHQPFNEPLSGNSELSGASTQDVVDLVKAIGTRFASEGFGAVKLVVASEETTTKSLTTAQAILNDPVARGYVGAIAYHSYPYGSTYCKVANIIGTSGSGAPNATEIQRRTALKNLAAMYGKQVWMTEVSHSEGDTWNTARGRAIHIHDEFLYAGANSYWGMFNIFDNSQGDLEDMVVAFNPTAGTWRITGMGRAIGHYARWITPKQSFLLTSSSSDPLVQISAFTDQARVRFACVLINNATTARQVTVNLTGGSLAGQVQGEVSTQSGGYWQPIPAFATGATSYTVTLPALSMTSLAAANGPVPPVNTAPTLATISNQTTTTGIAQNNIAVTIGDAETAPGSLTLSKASSNTALLPLSGITFGGSGSSRTVSLAPAAGQTGSATVTITVTDAGGLSASRNFTLTVNSPANSAPTLAAITDQTTTTGIAKNNIAVTIADAETAPGSLILSKASSNTTLLPLSGITFGGSGSSRTVSLAPAAGQTGSVTVTITVTDVGGLSASRNLSLTVSSPAPTFSAQVNFQPGSAPVPAGWLLDSGHLYAARNGQIYGWNTLLSASKYLRDRNQGSSPDQMYDTHLLVGNGGKAAAIWEMAVPNGNYQVTVVMGDPLDKYMPDAYLCTIEGITAINGTATTATNWLEVTMTVTISDGKVSLAFPGGSSLTNKICGFSILAILAGNG